MSDPNSVLSVWQMTLMITVPVVLLFGWLIAVFIAAREPMVSHLALTAPASTEGRDSSSQAAAEQDEEPRPERRLAA